jgi:HK97 family phage major capsid protein
MKKPNGDEPIALETLFDEDGNLRDGALPEDSPEYLETLLRSIREMKISADVAGSERERKIVALEERLKLAEDATTKRFNVQAAKVDDKPKPISLCRVACAAMERREIEPSYEREILHEEQSVRDFREAWYARARTLGTDVDSAGGVLVPEQYLPERFVEALKAQSIVRALGATVLPGLMAEPVKLPRETTRPTSYWTGESAAITESEGAYGDVEFRARELCTLVPVSMRLLRMGIPSVEALISRGIGASQGLAEDLAFLVGDGGENEPVGIQNTTGIGSTTMSANPTEDALRDIVKNVKDSDALAGRLGWAASVDAWDYIQRLKDGTGRSLFAGVDLSTGVPDRLLGYPIRDTTQIPTTANVTSIAFGNFEDAVIAEWGAVEFARSEHHDTAFAKRKVYLRACRLVDFALLRPESFCWDATLSVA